MTAVSPSQARQNTADAVPPALAALRAGRPVHVVTDANMEDGGAVVLAAALADPTWIAWTVRHTSGLLRAPLEEARADELDLPPMVPRNVASRGPAYTMSVDAARGVTTGISAADRAHTMRVLADAASGPADLTRPGHVLPMCAQAGGVLTRPRYTEAAVDLCRLAGLPPVGVIAEVPGGIRGVALGSPTRPLTSSDPTKSSRRCCAVRAITARARAPPGARLGGW